MHISRLFIAVKLKLLPLLCNMSMAETESEELCLLIFIQNYPYDFARIKTIEIVYFLLADVRDSTAVTKNHLTSGYFVASVPNS